MENNRITEFSEKQTIEEKSHIWTKGLNCTEISSCRELRKKVHADMEFLRWSATLTKEHTGNTAVVLRSIMQELEAVYSICNSHLKKLPAMPTTEKLPRIYVAALRFCSSIALSLSKESCNIFFDALQRDCSPSLSEYFSAKIMFYSTIVALSKKFTLESNTELLGKIPDAISFVSKFNFDIMAEKSTCAEILSQDPVGAYPVMTPESRLVYLHALCESSRKHKKNDIDYAKKLLCTSMESKSEKERHIGYIFYKKNNFQKKLYFLFVLVLPFIITLLSSIIFSPLCILAFFPVWEFTKLLSDYAFSKFSKSLPLPRMDIEKIPKESAVLVVITALLTGEDKDNILFERLSGIYHSNGESNVYFGLLADIPCGKYAKAASDEKIISYAYGRIASLNKKYGNKFILFERRRSYSKTEDKFMGWERKRGAVLELVRYLKGNSTTLSSESQTLAKEILGKSKIKYIVTLDSDTDMPFACVKDMYACMEHPLHTPVIDKNLGIVTDGYGVMQPRCTTGLSGASKTPFTRLFCFPDAISTHPFAHFDPYQNILGEGIFHGNGIFNVDVFYTVIDHYCTFPEDKILSHNCLEGEKLRCALLSDIEFCDSFPKHELSHLKRWHRRIRGDVQNLPFLFDKIVFDQHDTRKNTINALSKFKLFDNIRTAFLPCLTFLCVFISAFTSPITKNVLLFLSLSYCFIPVLFSLISSVNLDFKEKTPLRFFSKGIMPHFFTAFLRFLFLLSMLPVNALCSFDAIVRSLYRMYISGKNLLEWQSDGQNDNGDGSLLMFVHKNIFSFFSGFLLFVFAPAGILRFISLLWFAFPVIAYHTSREETPDKKKNAKYNPIFRKYAHDIWDYFLNNVTENENFLPPDNINIKKEEICHKTSPTNIGLYLLSILSARDFGFIDTNQLQEKISKTLDTIEKLQTWNGHLYSWYSTENLKVLPPYFISTVDSGNLTACLITLSRGLREYVYENTDILTLIKRIETIDENCNYAPLYNEDRNLFSTGATINKIGNVDVAQDCYELYMSKARTISYIQCARRNAPKKHWESLSRIPTQKSGYMGLLSINGAAIEYFLPELFLPTFKNSLCYEGLHFALLEQSRQSVKICGKYLWGISESHCYSENDNRDYKYLSSGVKSLALLKKDTKNIVITPYSSFLAMCVNYEKALSNLEKMKKCGFYGKYGFYEAIDIPCGSENEAKVEKSYVSQHLGMSLVALCNARFDNVMNKRFMSDSKMMSGTELLCEKIPVGAKIKKGSAFI